MRDEEEGRLRVAEIPSLVARSTEKQLSKDGGGKSWGKFGRKSMRLVPVTLKWQP